MKLAAYGMTVELPSGWEGRIYRRPGGDATLHAGSFPLPVDDADFGSGTVAAMNGDGAFVVLTEYERALAGQGLFQAEGLGLPLRGSDFSPRTLQRALPGLVGFQRFFTASDRAWCLYVVVGTQSNATALVEQTNHILGSVVLDAV